MPELPEVEVLRRSLEHHLLGRRIERVRVREPRLRERVNGRRLSSRVRGRPIAALSRRAKYLLVEFEGVWTLALHLGMSGRLSLKPKHLAPERHEHVVFFLSGGDTLRFCDPRRFGLVFACRTADLLRDRHFAFLGPEPLEADFNPQSLAADARGRRVPIKNFLMDARRVVGVGNIYASEALYRSGIHPRRAAGRISQRRWSMLVDSVRQVLMDAIRQGGTTLNDFADGQGNPGYFQVSLDVYAREGEPCRKCAHEIRRIVQSGRSTFFCPGCQR